MEYFSNQGIHVGDGCLIREVCFEGYDKLVGMIDEMEKVYYMPTLNHMQHRLKELPAYEFKRIMELYIEAGEELNKQGFHRRHISDY